MRKITLILLAAILILPSVMAANAAGKAKADGKGASGKQAQCVAAARGSGRFTSDSAGRAAVARCMKGGVGAI